MYTSAKASMHAPAFIAHVCSTPNNPFTTRKDGRLPLPDACPDAVCHSQLAKHGEVCGRCRKAADLDVTPKENGDFPAPVNGLTYAQYNALFPVHPGFGRFQSFACLVSARGEVQDYSQVFAWSLDSKSSSTKETEQACEVKSISTDDDPITDLEKPSNESIQPVQPKQMDQAGANKSTYTQND